MELRQLVMAVVVCGFGFLLRAHTARTRQLPGRAILMATMVALGVATSFLAQPASADSIVLTPDVTTATLTEGQSLPVIYTAVITVAISGESFIIGGETFNSQLNPSGDPADLLALQRGTDNCLGEIFFGTGDGTAANTCTVEITYVPSLDAGVEDFDSGTATARFVITGGAVISNNADTVYTVNDVSAVSAAPEPSSLVLLGGGLLALAGRLRRTLLRKSVVIPLIAS